MKENLLCANSAEAFQPCISHFLAERKNSKAFSLVEMLMALLVASLLMAALAPVMTKKMNENLNMSVTTGVENIQFCGYVNDGAGDIEYGLSNSRACKVPSEVYSMSAIIASAGGGGAGALDAKKGTVRISEAIYGTAGGAQKGNGNTRKEYTITKDMTDIEIELLAGGGAGGSGKTNNGGYPANQTDCGNWGVYVDYSQNAATNDDGSIQHSVCVSRYNPSNTGDGLATPESNITGVTNVPIKTTCSTASSANCCWYGATSGTNCDISKNGMTYSGCDRMVCQWNAANTICSNWKPTSTTSTGRLPYKAEFETWAPYISDVNLTTPGPLNKPNGSFPGLQLCDYRAGYGALLCSYNTSSCLGSYANTCRPYGVWSSTFINDTNYHNYWLDAGTFAYNSTNNYMSAFSVRCVIDRISEYKAYTGGGGAGSMYMKVKIPNETLQQAFAPDANGNVTETLRLELIAGHGSDAKYYDEHYNETNADRSEGSAVYLYKGNELIWYASNPFSYSGHKADIAANGYLGGSRPAENPWCSYYNKYDTNPDYRTAKPFPCNEIATVKEPLGAYFSDRDQTGGLNRPQTGTGTRSYWPVVPGSLTEDYQAPASAGTESSVNGAAGGFGSGGGGGYCKEGPTRLAPECGIGGNGGPGAARFTYLRTIPGVGGGGGGSGSVLHVKNIQVQPNSVIAVGVGAGGRGGEAGADGTDGGSSYIQLPDSANTKYEVFGGKKGKVGITGNPNLVSYIYSTPGVGGEYGGIGSTLPSNTNNYEYYPNTNSERETAKGKNAPDTGASTGAYILKAAGGDGGINTKTFLGRGTENSRIPCGGFSTSKIKINNKEYKCERQDNSMPFIWKRVLNQDDFTSQDINFYPLGALGGGGGGWQRNGDISNVTSSGAAGLGGYVFIYFNK